MLIFGPAQMDGTWNEDVSRDLVANLGWEGEE